MMKRTATATVLGVILVGTITSMAAINAGSSSVVPDLKGKTVIIDSGFPPVENATLGVIGKREFIVLPITRDDGSSVDIWKPLDSLSLLHVYDSMEEATEAHNQRRHRLTPRSGQSTGD